VHTRPLGFHDWARTEWVLRWDSNGHRAEADG
jgi:hypothetical protein